ncbi:Predicted arabinose efflux permease, MFS family [Micromonospora pallida]|uniref:Multidrug efflux pump Tap n=1 Tax=Micromonospora pallida TaxID=145854 RepID=A0A1C6S8F4_9ACTN|nr:MFS transporter [Micromonospora pallida]SCL25756.1 Predicted arabinose efflux permease, MFS family [Micromonospora pallida]
MPSRSRAALVGLLTAGTISDTGTRVSTVTLPWLVLVSTGSPTRMGLVVAAEMLPYVLVSALGPPLVDRLGARRVSITADLASAGCMALLAATYGFGFATLLGLVAVIGVLRGLGDNAKRAMAHATIAAAGASMARVSSIDDGLHRMSILVGAPAAGVIIAWFGITQAILIDAASFAVAAAIVTALIPASIGRPTHTDTTEREPYLKALGIGLRHLRQDQVAVGIFAVMFIVNLFNQASVAVYIPLWVDRVLDNPAALGAVSGALALGAIVGNIGFTIAATRLPRYVTFTIGLLVGGAPRFLALAFSHDLLVVIAITFVSGVALSSVNPIIAATILERTPPALQARMFGLATAVSWASIPLGGVLGGWAASALGLTVSIALSGLLYLLVALTLVLRPARWRRLDEPPPTTATAAEPART